MGGKKNQGDAARPGIVSEFIGHLPAVEVRQAKVENDHIRLRSPSKLKSGGTVLRLEDVVGGDEDGVAEGTGCLAGAAATAQPAVLGAEVSALAARGRFRRLGQCRIEPFGALAWPARATLAGRLVIAGALPGPGGEVGVAGEDAHVDAYLSDQYLGAEAGDAGDRHQQLALSRERGDYLLDLLREEGDRLVE